VARYIDLKALWTTEQLRSWQLWILKGSSPGIWRTRSNWRIDPDVILLTHGAALVNPEDAQYVLNRTECYGMQLGSSVGRLAIEEPMKKRAASFKTIQFRKAHRP